MGRTAGALARVVGTLCIAGGGLLATAGAAAAGTAGPSQRGASDGTGSFEGNTGQELYEWPEANTTTYYFNSFAEMHALCGSPWGCDPF